MPSLILLESISLQESAMEHEKDFISFLNIVTNSLITA